MQCKILTPSIEKINPGTWATSCTLQLIFQRVLQTPFLRFKGNFSRALDCLVMARSLKMILLISKEFVEFCIQGFNLQRQGHDGPKVMISEVKYQNSILSSGFGAAWNSTI